MSDDFLHLSLTSHIQPAPARLAFWPDEWNNAHTEQAKRTEQNTTRPGKTMMIQSSIQLRQVNGRERE